MTFLKLDQSLSDPFAQPTWVHAIEEATPFKKLEGASEAKVRIADGSGIRLTNTNTHWYVVRI
jgi:hypothetical protein